MYNINTRYAGQLLSGLSASPGPQVAYILMLESAPERVHATLSTVLMQLQALIVVVCGVYFLFISSNWFYWGYFALAFQLASAVLFYFTLESPKFYMSQGERSKAAASLDKIASLNGYPKYTIPTSFAQEGKKKEGSKSSAWAFLSNRVLLKNLLICIVCWCSVSFNFYLIS